MKQAFALQEIKDVTISEPAFGDCLVFNGKSWVNASPIGPLIQRANFFLSQGRLSTYFSNQGGFMPYFAKNYEMSGVVLLFPFGES